MKRVLSLSLLLLLALTLASCFDSVQYISLKGGKHHQYFKFTASKALMEMGEISEDDVWAGMADALGDCPDYVDVEQVDTDLEIGVSIDFGIDEITDPELLEYMSIKREGNKTVLPFLAGMLMNSAGEDSLAGEMDESEGIAQAMLLSAKARLMVSKDVVPEVNVAYFEGKGGQNYSVACFDYGDCFCLEVPFALLFWQSEYDVRRIVLM